MEHEEQRDENALFTAHTPLAEKVWSTPALRSNILSFLPCKFQAKALILSKEVYESCMKQLYGHTLLADYLTVLKAALSYPRLRTLRHSIRTIDLRGCLALEHPFFGFVHLCDTFPRLTSILTSSKSLYHVEDTEKLHKRRWNLSVYLDRSLGESDTYITPVSGWVVPDEWAVEELYGLSITQQTRPERNQRSNTNDNGERSHWLTEIGKDGEANRHCVPAALLECTSRTGYLGMSGHVEGSELVKMFKSMVVADVGLPSVLEMNCEKGNGLECLPALGGILGRGLEHLDIAVPSLSFDQALQRDQWSSFTHLRHLEIIVILSPNGSTSLLDLLIDPNIPPLYLTEFRIKLGRSSDITLYDYVSKLDTMLPATHDLARAMYAIGGPTCKYMVRLRLLNGMGFEKKDIPYYVRTAKHKKNAMSYVQAYHVITMYQRMFGREIRKLEGVETVEKGWFRVEKEKVMTGDAGDVGADVEEDVKKDEEMGENTDENDVGEAMKDAIIAGASPHSYEAASIEQGKDELTMAEE